jgi:hypothetical protein
VRARFLLGALGAVFLSLVALPGCPPPDNGGDGGDDGGDQGDAGVDAGCVNGFCNTTLDPSRMALFGDFTPQLAAALGPNDRIGIAYLKADAGLNPDGGPNLSYAIQYMEWQNGNVTVGPEVVQTVHNADGLSVAFQSTGQPAVAYLGGPADLNTSTLWWNNDAVTAYRTGTNAWTEHTAVMDSNEAMGDNNVSNTGYLVGIYPALAFDSTNKAYLAYRDCHSGQSVGTGDYNGSDLELAEGGPTAWTHTMLQEGGNDKLSWGGLSRMLMVGDQPAMVMSRVIGVPNGYGTDVYFLRRDGGSGNPSWTAPIIVSAASQVSPGPSLAYDGTKYGVAFTDLQATGGQALYFAESARTADGGVSFPVKDVVVQAGSGGWYPYAAYRPSTKDPSIVYHVCSVRLGFTDYKSCPASEDELQLSERIGGYWYPTTVDTAGGFQPHLFYLSNDKRVIVYRDPRYGTVRIAVEQ